MRRYDRPEDSVASSAAAYLYVVSPGPAFLALFTLAASKGRASGAYFICGHLVGDVTWGALAVAAIIGANQLGATLFEALGFGCGLYLVYLGVRAVMTRRTRRRAPSARAARSRPALRSASPTRRPIPSRSRCSRRSLRLMSTALRWPTRRNCCWRLRRLSRRRRDADLRRRPCAGEALLSQAWGDRDAGRRRDVHRVRGKVDLRCGEWGDEEGGVGDVEFMYHIRVSVSTRSRPRPYLPL